VADANDLLHGPHQVLAQIARQMAAAPSDAPAGMTHSWPAPRVALGLLELKPPLAHIAANIGHGTVFG
jgi:hypothetical protein